MRRYAPAQRRQRGAIRILAITTLLMATFLMFLLIDLSQTAARRAELQVAVDAAALAAAVTLKNTPDAYLTATSVAGQGLNTYNYRIGSGNKIKLPAATVQFGATHDETDWKPAAAAPPGFKYVRVLTSAAPDEDYLKVNLLLMPGLTAITHDSTSLSTVTVSAVAVAGPLKNSIGLRK